jgi:hypothetical protein
MLGLGGKKEEVKVEVPPPPYLEFLFHAILVRLENLSMEIT